MGVLNSEKKDKSKGTSRLGKRGPVMGLVLLLLVSAGVGGGWCAQPNAAFPSPISMEAFPGWMKELHGNLRWDPHVYNNQLSHDVLKKSFGLGRQFMIRNQKPAGNFNYEYDFVKKSMNPDDSQVRQSGALWGLSLIYQYEQTEEARKVLEKAMRFFFKYTQPGFAEGALHVAYPGETKCDTGTVALVGLGIVEYLRTEKAGKVKIDPALRKEMVKNLEGYLKHLQFVRLENKHFAKSCSLMPKAKGATFSPYFDGETMLCLIKAAKYLGYKDLIPTIEESAMVMAKNYTADQWYRYPDSDQTKGFFQWSCMAFWEYQDAGWKNSEVFGNYVLSLAWWMIHTHQTLDRTRNTAYAYEGIIHAYRIAKKRGDKKAMHELSYVIDAGLYKLTTWQVGGPLLTNSNYLMSRPTSDPLAVGGIMNHAREAPLRIDVTQHQMHSVILALKHVYPK